MTRRTETIPADHFAEMYEGDSDPWHFATSAYERGKYAADDREPAAGNATARHWRSAVRSACSRTNSPGAAMRFSRSIPPLWRWRRRARATPTTRT